MNLPLDVVRQAALYLDFPSTWALSRTCKELHGGISIFAAGRAAILRTRLDHVDLEDVPWWRISGTSAVYGLFDLPGHMECAFLLQTPSPERIRVSPAGACAGKSLRIFHIGVEPEYSVGHVIAILPRDDYPVEVEESSFTSINGRETLFIPNPAETLCRRTTYKPHGFFFLAAEQYSRRGFTCRDASGVSPYVFLPRDTRDAFDAMEEITSDWRAARPTSPFQHSW